MKKTHKLSESQKTEIEALFISGERFTAISKKFNVTPSAIRIMLNNRGHFARYHGSLSPQLHQEICNKYVEEKLQIKELSDIYNVSTASIRFIIKKYNITFRSPMFSRRKYKVNDDYFSKIDTAEKAYILGLLYADGCNHPESRKITLSLQSGDESILYSIQKELGSDKPLYYRKPKSSISKSGKIINSHGHYVLVVISEQISKDLSIHGVTKNKSLDLSWPNLGEDLMHHFIRGFFDGDGSISSKGKISFMGNKDFMIPLKKYLMEKISTPDNKLLKHSICNVYYYNFSSRNDVKNFFNFVYKDSNLFINRKKEKFYSLGIGS